MRNARRSLLACLVTVSSALAACSDPTTTPHDAGPDSDFVRSYTEPRCTTVGLLPFRDNNGGTACDHVGAGATTPPGMWPGTADLVAPFAFVQPGAAAAGADGTMAHPYPDIAAALAAMPTATAIVLSAGTHTVASTITISTGMPIEFRGTGAAMGGTFITPTMRAPVFVASGAMTEVDVNGVAITFNGVTAADTMAVGVVATSMGSMVLRDVSIDNAYDGAVATGGVIDLGYVTISGSLHRGVSLASGSDGTRASASVADSLVRDGFGQGFVSEGANIGFVHSGVVRNLRGGLIIRGADPMFPNSLDAVTVTGNSLVGCSISGADAAIIVSQMLAAGTQSSSDGLGGDGLYIGPGGSVVMDMAIMGDDLQGTGSAFVANARTGILVSGDAAMPPPTGGNLQMNAALVASNRGGGMIVQNGASVPMIAFSVFAQNSGVGLATTTQGLLATIQGSQFLENRNGTVTTGVGDIPAGDGLSLGDAPAATPIAITDVEFTSNSRYAAVFTAGAITLTNTRGTGNGYGIGNYGGSVTMSGTNTVAGEMSAPSSAPMVVRGAMIPPP